MGCMGANKIYYMEYKTMNKLSEKKKKDSLGPLGLCKT